MSMNKIFILGHVGQDPRINIANGKKVANFSVATTHKSGNIEETTWFSITTWEKQAEVIEKFVGKGTLIFVEGRMRMNKYTDAQGIEKMFPEVIANNIQLLSRKEDSSQNRPPMADDDLPDNYPMV